MAYSSGEYKGGNIFTLAAFLIGLYIIVAEFAIIKGRSWPVARFSSARASAFT